MKRAGGSSLFVVGMCALAACGETVDSPDASPVDASAGADVAVGGDASILSDAAVPDAGPGTPDAMPDAMPDLIPPDTTITMGPPSLSNSTGVSFAFTATEIGSTFQCRFDADAYAACSSPLAVTVGEGAHTFDVYAVDMAGNPDPSPATWSFVVDITPPDTTIDSGPSGAVASTTATFQFSSTETGIFECALDGGAFASCASPVTFTGLSESPHDLAVRAIDDAGNVDPTPATRSWTPDITAPDTSLTGTPPDPSTDSSATFTFASPDGTATFECDVDAGGYAACTSPHTLIGLSAGGHDFSVRAVDTAGNVDPTPATYSWAYDPAPDTVLDQAPLGATNLDSATFAFSSPSAGVTFECNVDGGGFSTCTSPQTLSSLSFSSHTFEVRAVSALGTPDPTPASHAWTVTSEPLLRYAFDGDATNSGAIAGYDGVASSVTYQPGWSREAVVFGDSPTSDVTIPNSRDVLSVSPTYTLAVWFREDSALNSPPVRRMIDFRGGTGGFETYHGASGTALYTCYSASPSGGTCGNVSYSVGSWHHLLFRYDGTSTSAGGGAPIEIYIDDVLSKTLANSAGNVIFSAGQLADLVLGRSTNFYLDDFRVYDATYTVQEQCTRIMGGAWDGVNCLTPQPILHYELDGDALNSGTLSSYDGVEASMSYTTGKFGQAALFDGTASSAVTVPGARTPLSAGPDYTVGLWFREDSVVNNPTAYLIHTRGGTGGFESYHGASGTALYTCYSAAPSGGACANFSYSVGTWHHLLYRYDGTSTSPGGGAPLEIYLDGALVTTVANAASNVIFSSGQALDLLIGSKTNFYVDDVRIYDQVFTPAEQCAIVVRGVWSGSACTLP